MTELEFHFHTGVEFSAPVSGHTFAPHCLPVEDDAQKLQSYIIHIEPAAVCKQKLNTLLILLLPKNTWTGSVPVGALPVYVFFRLSPSWGVRPLCSPARLLQGAAPAARCRSRQNGGRRYIAVTA